MSLIVNNVTYIFACQISGNMNINSFFLKKIRTSERLNDQTHDAIILNSY